MKKDNHLIRIFVHVSIRGFVCKSAFNQVARCFVFKYPNDTQFAGVPLSHSSLAIVSDVQALDRTSRNDLDRSATHVVLDDEHFLSVPVEYRLASFIAVVFES